MKIVNIVVCFKNDEEIVQFARQFQKQQSQEQIELIVVINELSQGKIEKLIKELDNLGIIYNIYNPNINLGYLNGLIYGYRQYIKTNDKADWIIFSNTDIQYDVGKIRDYIDKRNFERDIWCIGPAVYAESRKTYDNPVALKRRSEREVKKLIKIFRTPILNVIYITLSDIKARILSRQMGDSQNVYEVHGCFFIVGKELGDLLVESGYPFFLYSEEAYIAELVYHNGKRIVYDNNISVIHSEHSVTGVLKKQKIARYMSESLRMVYDIFYKRGL